MVFIPMPQQPANQPPVDPRKAAHDMTVGMLVMALICLAISLFIFIVGPLSDNPPPLLVGYVVLGIAVIFGFVSFFSWMKEQADSFGSGDSAGPSA